MFHKAFGKNKEYNNLEIELLKHKVPLHLGGMSDPFQNKEWEYFQTYKLLQLSKEFDYPIQISTKVAQLSDKHWEVLDNQLHAFQISLISPNKNFIDEYETNTPTPQQRINFIKKLKRKGFWVGLRIQPLIDIDQAIELISNVKNYINYITIEHLKIPSDNPHIKQLFNFGENHYKYYYPTVGKNYELNTQLKKDNIKKIKQITNTPIGIGDNDLHYLSDSRNCCGLDTIGQKFNHYLKYNSTYFNTEGKNKNIWYPKSSCNHCFASDTRKENLTTVKDYVDYYMKEYYQNEKVYQQTFFEGGIK